MTFDELYSLCSNQNVLLAYDRAKRFYEWAREAAHLEGEFWECGVFRGGSARMLAEAITQHEGPQGRRESRRPLRLFDTFKGLPKPQAEDDFSHAEGDFAGSLEVVSDFLKDFDFVSYHPGLIPRTFVGFDDVKIAFCHSDVDQYHSTLGVLEFVWPRLVPGGMIVLDDYTRPADPGVERAVVTMGFKDRVQQFDDWQGLLVKGRAYLQKEG